MKTLKLQKNEGAQFITVGLRFQLQFPDYKFLDFSIDLAQPFWLFLSTDIYVSSAFPSMKDKSYLFWALRVVI